MFMGGRLAKFAETTCTVVFLNYGLSGNAPVCPNLKLPSVDHFGFWLYSTSAAADSIDLFTTIDRNIVILRR